MKHKTAEEIEKEIANEILKKYFRPKAYDVKEASEMGRGILYFEEDAIKAMLEYRSQQVQVEGLPNLDKITSHFGENEWAIVGAEWAIKEASAIIAKKDEELKLIKKQANFEIERQKDMLNGQCEEIDSIKSELTALKAENEDAKNSTKFWQDYAEKQTKELDILRKENEQLKKRPSEGHNVSEFYKD